MLLRLLIFTSIVEFGASFVTLPAYYDNGMVLQADTDNLLIWGFTTNTEVEVTVEFSCSYREVRQASDSLSLT